MRAIDPEQTIAGMATTSKSSSRRAAAAAEAAIEMIRRTRNPDTGEFEDAEWIPHFRGPIAGVRFPSRPDTIYLENAFDDVGGLEVEEREIPE